MIVDISKCILRFNLCVNEVFLIQFIISFRCFTLKASQQEMSVESISDCLFKSSNHLSVYLWSLPVVSSLVVELEQEAAQARGRSLVCVSPGVSPVV